jgi:hypothetical protein
MYSIETADLFRVMHMYTYTGADWLTIFWWDFFFQGAPKNKENENKHFGKKHHIYKLIAAFIFRPLF